MNTYLPQINLGSGCGEHPLREQEGETSRTQKQLLKSAFVAFCLFSILVLPTAAAPAGQATSSHAIDQGLNDDLWNNHQQYRLQRFRYERAMATSMISILNKYGIDTTTCQNTLLTISSQRTAFETALTAKDKKGD
jgi:hypothetical protein